MINDTISCYVSTKLIFVLLVGNIRKSWQEMMVNDVKFCSKTILLATVNKSLYFSVIIYISIYLIARIIDSWL